MDIVLDQLFQMALITYCVKCYFIYSLERLNVATLFLR